MLAYRSPYIYYLAPASCTYRYEYLVYMYIPYTVPLPLLKYMYESTTYIGAYGNTYGNTCILMSDLELLKVSQAVMGLPVHM